MGIYRNFSLRNWLKSVSYFLIILVIFSILYLTILPMASVYASQEEEYTYATATLKIVRTSISGDYTIYSTVKLKIPKHIYIDKEVKIEAYFSRSACWNSYSVVFTVGAKVKTSNGNKEYDLTGGSFSLYCNIPGSQTKELDITIPKAVYEHSVDKIVTIYIKDMSVSPKDSWIKSTSVVTNIPAEAYLVYGVPQPILSVKDIERGYLNLTVGENRNIIILLTSMYAPILVENINATVPEGFIAYVNTPLPLTVGTNETKPIIITVRGVQPGIGILSVNIYYYTGVETKRISIYIPVICEQNQIYELIDQYKQEINKLRQETQELENQLGIDVATSENLAQQINNIIITLNNLIPQYKDILRKSNVLENKVTGLENELNNVKSNIAGLSSRIDALKNEINSLSNKVDSLEKQNSLSLAKLTSELNIIKSELIKLSKNLSITKSELNNTENKMVILKSELDGLRKVNTILAVSVIITLITIAIVLIFRKRE